MLLEFNREQIEEFIEGLNKIIIELQIDMAEIQSNKKAVEGYADGSSISAYGKYGVELADYKNSLRFYEAIKADLQEFLDEVDENAKFTRDSNFLYDDKLIEEIKAIADEKEVLNDKCYMDILDREYTPYGILSRGNFLHKGSPEEQLIDSNDGKTQAWAEEINAELGKLYQSVEELDTLHKLYFEGISLEDLKKEHDKSDGIAEHSAQWHAIGSVVTSVGMLGGAAYSSRSIYKKNLNLRTKYAAAYSRYSEELLKYGITEEKYLESLKNSIHNVDAEALALGKYETDGISYEVAAVDNREMYFEMADWDEYAKDLGTKNMFEYFNEPALEFATDNNMDVHLIHDPNKYRYGDYEKELKYLGEKEYSIVQKDGEWWAIKEKNKVGE